MEFGLKTELLNCQLSVGLYNCVQAISECGVCICLLCCVFTQK